MLRLGTVVAAVGVGAAVYLHPPSCLSPWLDSHPFHCLLSYGAAVGCAVYLLPAPAPARVDPAGKAVVITGCDSGFGQMLAKRLHDVGYLVFAGCLAPDREGALKLKQSTSSRLHVIELDVTDDFHVQRAQSYVSSHLKDAELWAVVNNAGLGLVAEIEWCSVDQFQRILDVNVLGVVRVTKAFLPLLRYSKGRVVNVASLSGRLTLPMYAAYSMSKKAVVAFSDALRQEMRKFEVSVISIEPGLYKTPIATADAYIHWNRQSWSQTPTDVKEDYGEEYFDAAMSKIRDSMGRARDQVEEVIAQMELAVCARRPRHRYVPHGMSYVRSEILRLLPSSWTDRIFSATVPKVKPRLVVRQESFKQN
ncbi:short-chain dehydrogenase/reductase family 9C member 7-like [Babylonia areolata]|uniref:short-chain dehydrogenase/reductase family 9C member 7-like n=1 Tax=Babylonia areolata TaxID=304850 RepID=UPI003FD1578C